MTEDAISNAIIASDKGLYFILTKAAKAYNIAFYTVQQKIQKISS